MLLDSKINKQKQINIQISPRNKHLETTFAVVSKISYKNRQDLYGKNNKTFKEIKENINKWKIHKWMDWGTHFCKNGSFLRLIYRFNPYENSNRDFCGTNQV